jgi:HEPN domain-containing protein
MKQHDAERERTTVIDDNIGDYTKPQLFFRLAIAYADSSHQIVRSMLAGDLPQTFAHAQTTHFLFDHAVELFLKGAILKSTGKIENTHDLQPLFGRYRNLYPKKAFEFTIRIAETVKANPQSPHSKFPRYPMDADGNVWEGHNAYTLETWLAETEHLRQDLERLIAEIDPLPPPAISE